MIASHPVMCKNVRELCYDSQTLSSPMKDFATWKVDPEELLMDPCRGRNALDAPVLNFAPVRTRSDFRRRYAWYPHCMWEQEYFVEQKRDWLVFRDTFANLTSLKKITMNTQGMMYLPDIYNNIGPWDYPLELPYDTITPAGVHKLSILLYAAGESKIKLRKIRAGRLS